MNFEKGGETTISPEEEARLREAASASQREREKNLTAKRRFIDSMNSPLAMAFDLMKNPAQGKPAAKRVIKEGVDNILDALQEELEAQRKRNEFEMIKGKEDEGR